MILILSLFDDNPKGQAHLQIERKSGQKKQPWPILSRKDRSFVLSVPPLLMFPYLPLSSPPALIDSIAFSTTNWPVVYCYSWLQKTCYKQMECNNFSQWEKILLRRCRKTVMINTNALLMTEIPALAQSRWKIKCIFKFKVSNYWP